MPLPTYSSSNLATPDEMIAVPYLNRPRSETIREQLSQAFNHSMQIWRQTAVGWRPLRLHPDETIPFRMVDGLGGHEFDSWLDQLVAQNGEQPQSRMMGDRQAFIAIPSYADDGSPQIVGGLVTLDIPQLVNQTAEMSLLNVVHIDNQSLLTEYANRLSSTYEEMAFLRHLSQHIKHCVANRSLADVTVTILPQLGELIAVEGVALIVPMVPEIDSQTSANPIQKVPQLGSIECRYGDWPMSESVLFELINRLPKFESQTVVRNQSQGWNEKYASVTGLRSILITPVRSDNVLYGWLVGINKRIQSPADLVMDDTGRNELGSNEATLLESAALMLSSHASNNRLYEEMETFMVQAIQTLVGVIEAKDGYTFGHSDRVATIARRLAEELKLPTRECHDIYLAGLLHDIGKVGVPDDVLLKPGRLTEGEFAKIKLHPEIGARLIRGLKPLTKLIPGVLHHHESYDGTGYPQRLAGETIPFMARVLAVADAFDAMTSCRPYRQGMTFEVTADILRSGSERQWDPQVIEAFFACEEDIKEIMNQPANVATRILEPELTA